MKYASLFVIIVAIALVIFNCTKIDFSNPFVGESIVAIITVIASLCAILLMLILRTSKRIEQKVRNKQ